MFMVSRLNRHVIGKCDANFNVTVSVIDSLSRIT